MCREDLITAVRRAAEWADYAFVSGNEHIATGKISSNPTAWLQSAKLVKTNGRSEKKRVYRVIITMLTNAIKGSSEEDGWVKLEKDALDICRELEKCEHIMFVKNFKSAPNKIPITKNGEVGITTEFEVEMFYVE